jgi:hypothetical protein
MAPRFTPGRTRADERPWPPPLVARPTLSWRAGRDLRARSDTPKDPLRVMAPHAACISRTHPLPLAEGRARHSKKGRRHHGTGPFALLSAALLWEFGQLAEPAGVFRRVRCGVLCSYELGSLQVERPSAAAVIR